MWQQCDPFTAEIPGKKRECSLLLYGFLAACCQCHVYFIQRPSLNCEYALNLFNRNAIVSYIKIKCALVFATNRYHITYMYRMDFTDLILIIIILSINEMDLQTKFTLLLSADISLLQTRLQMSPKAVVVQCLQIRK